MVPLLAQSLGTATSAVSAAKLGPKFLNRRSGVSGLNSRSFLLPRTLCLSLLPSSRFLPGRCLSVSATSSSDGASLFLHSLGGISPSGFDRDLSPEEEFQVSTSDDRVCHDEKSLSSHESAEEDYQNSDYFEEDFDCLVSDSRPSVEGSPQEEDGTTNAGGQSNFSEDQESSSSAVNGPSQFYGRSTYSMGGNDYQSWTPSSPQHRGAFEEEGLFGDEVGDGLLDGNNPHDPSHLLENEDEQGFQQTVAEVAVELGDGTDFQTSSLIGESESVDGNGEDLLVEFLGERSKKWVDGKTSRDQLERQSVFGRTSRSTLIKQKSKPNPPGEEAIESEGMASFSGLIYADKELSKLEMPFPKAQRASAESGDGSEPGGLVGDILKLARSLPQNSTLEEFLKPFHGKVSTKDGNKVLRALGAEQMTWPLLSFFQWMRLQDPCLLDSRSFCIVFTYLGKVAMVDQALTLYRNLPADSKFHAVQVYNALITTLARFDRGDSIAAVLEDMKERKVERDTVTYSLLITATHKEKERLQKVWSMFDDMLENGLSPDLAVFGNIIKAFCDGGYHKQASLISISMEKMGLIPNVIIYNTLIDAYGKAGQLEEAEGLLVEMTRRGLHPTANTYNSLINGYGKRGQCEVAEELILDMEKQGLKPDVYTYTSLIRAYGKQKLTEKAVNVFLRMRKIGIVPTTHTYTALVNAYAEAGWHDRAQMTFANMQRGGLKPTVETYTALLDGYRRAGKVDKVLQVWKEMKEEGCELTQVTYNTLMDAFAKQGRFNEARDVMAEMRANGMEPDLMSYNMLLNAYGRGGLQSKLPKIVREMRDAGYEPDSFTYCTLIYANLRLRDFTSAFMWEREMSENGKRPDSKTYSKMKYLLNAKFTEKQENDRKAALGQIRAMQRKVRKNPQRLKTFKKEIAALKEGPLAGYRRPKKAGPNQKQSEKDKALWKREDDDQRYP